MSVPYSPANAIDVLQTEMEMTERAIERLTTSLLDAETSAQRIRENIAVAEALLVNVTDARERLVASYMATPELIKEN